jgi:hypothetical protein
MTTSEQGEIQRVTAKRLSPLGPVRVLTIAQQPWTVEEVVDTTLGCRSLIFSSTGVARRVRRYPADWRTLADDLLYALSWSC